MAGHACIPLLQSSHSSVWRKAAFHMLVKMAGNLGRRCLLAFLRPLSRNNGRESVVHPCFPSSCSIKFDSSSTRSCKLGILSPKTFAVGMYVGSSLVRNCEAENIKLSCADLKSLSSRKCRIKIRCGTHTETFRYHESFQLNLYFFPRERDLFRD